MQQFRAYYEDTGRSEIQTAVGEVSLLDLEYLLDEASHRLSPRQYQAIQLCLIGQMREQDAAVIMGIAPSNPVAMYATDGLRRLVAMVERDELPRMRREVPL